MRGLREQCVLVCGKNGHYLVREAVPVPVPVPRGEYLLKPTTKGALVGDGCRRRRLGRPRCTSGRDNTGGWRRPPRQDGGFLDCLPDEPPDVRSSEVQDHGVIPAGALQVARGLAVEVVPLGFSSWPPAGNPGASLFALRAIAKTARKSSLTAESSPAKEHTPAPPGLPSIPSFLDRAPILAATTATVCAMDILQDTPEALHARHAQPGASAAAALQDRQVNTHTMRFRVRVRVRWCCQRTGAPTRGGG